MVHTNVKNYNKIKNRLEVEVEKENENINGFVYLNSKTITVLLRAYNHRIILKDRLISLQLNICLEVASYKCLQQNLAVRNHGYAKRKEKTKNLKLSEAHRFKRRFIPSGSIVH